MLVSSGTEYLIAKGFFFLFLLLLALLAGSNDPGCKSLLQNTHKQPSKNDATDVQNGVGGGGGWEFNLQNMK